MQRFQRALDFFFARDRAVPRRQAPRRLLMESLETRHTLSTVPFYISDQTFLDQAKTTQAFSPSNVYVAMYAKDFDTTTHYYFWNSSGITQETNPGTPIQSFALSSLTFNQSQNAYEIDLPSQLPDSSNPGVNSARVYFSFGTPFSLGVNGDGTVNGLTGNEGFYYDFTEFTYNDPSNPGNLNIDITNVDQFGAPMKITVDSPDPKNIAAGVGAAATRKSILSQYEQFTAGTNFASDVFPGSGTYGTYRILSPGDALNQSPSAGTFVDAGTVLQLAVPAGSQGAQQVITVASAAAFPNPNNGAFDVVVGTPSNNEVMHVTSAAPGPFQGTTNWTVTRGANAQAWGAATPVQLSNPAVTATQTTLPAGSSSQFPSTYPFYVLVDSEVMKVTGQSADNNGKPIWTVVRGQFGSTATTHNEGAPIVYDAQTNNPLNSYFSTAIDALFGKYKAGTGNTLDLVSGADGQTYHGQVVPFDAQVPGSPYVLRFHDDANPNDFYDVYYPFFNDNRYLWAGYTPALGTGAAPSWLVNNALANYSSSEMVFLCNSVFQSKKFEPSVNPAVLGDLENQVVSALNRGVAQLPSSQWHNSSMYYGNNSSGERYNVYAQFMHKTTVSIDGLAYGFAFDDQGSNASDISVNSVASTTTTLLPWANDSSPPGPPGPGPGPGTGFSQRRFLASTPIVVPPHVTPTPSSVGQGTQSATNTSTAPTSTTISKNAAVASTPSVRGTLATTTTAGVGKASPTVTTAKNQSQISPSHNTSSSNSSVSVLSVRSLLSSHALRL